jgi:hypothetical protein
MKRATSDARRMKPRVLRSIGVVLLVFAIGLTACSDLGEIIDAFEYIGARGPLPLTWIAMEAQRPRP